MRRKTVERRAKVAELLGDRKPRSAYEISRDSGIRSVWLYPLLRRLENDKLVWSYWETSTRRVYTLEALR